MGLWYGPYGVMCIIYLHQFVYDSSSIFPVKIYANLFVFHNFLGGGRGEREAYIAWFAPLSWIMPKWSVIVIDLWLIGLLCSLNRLLQRKKTLKLVKF